MNGKDADGVDENVVSVDFRSCEFRRHRLSERSNHEEYKQVRIYFLFKSLYH